jgi:hypothetical protein
MVMSKWSACLFALAFSAGILQRIRTPAADVTVLTPAQARLEVPVEPMTPAAPPNATCAQPEVVVDTSQSANVWIQIASVAAAFFSLIGIVGWP